jgi:hypothetical protein
VDILTVNILRGAVGLQIGAVTSFYAEERGLRVLRPQLLIHPERMSGTNDVLDIAVLKNISLLKAI